MKNEYYLAITGKTCIEEPLEKDKEYPVIFKGVSIYGNDERSNNDGTEKITFKGKAVGWVKIADGQKVIKGEKKKGSQSQVLRQTLFDIYEDKYYTEYPDFETFYKTRMSEIINSQE